MPLLSITHVDPLNPVKPDKTTTNKTHTHTHIQSGTITPQITH